MSSGPQGFSYDSLREMSLRICPQLDIRNRVLSTYLLIACRSQSLSHVFVLMSRRDFGELRAVCYFCCSMLIFNMSGLVLIKQRNMESNVGRAKAMACGPPAAIHVTNLQNKGRTSVGTCNSMQNYLPYANSNRQELSHTRYQLRTSTASAFRLISM